MRRRGWIGPQTGSINFLGFFLIFFSRASLTRAIGEPRRRHALHICLYFFLYTVRTFEIKIFNEYILKTPKVCLSLSA